MEPSLARLLARKGIEFTKIGPEVDYFGPVTPYILNLRELKDKLQATHPEWLEGL